MTVVSNTGPVIALAKADQLEILSKLYQRVFIPSAVNQELRMGSGPAAEIGRIEAAISGGILQVIDRRGAGLIHPPDTVVESRTWDLDPGEREAIGLVFQMRGLFAFQPLPLLLIDDKAGRRTARELGVTVKGVAGILVQAKEDGHIAEVGPLLNSIRDNGYWLSDAVVRSALICVGEATA